MIGKVSLFGRYDFGAGVNARLELYAEGFAEDGLVKPYVEIREEYERGADIEIEKRDWFLFQRFTPYFSIGGASRESSIEAFGFTEGRFRIGVQRAF